MLPPGRLRFDRPSNSVEDFEQSCCALAASDAHRHDAVLRLATLALEEEMACATGAGHAVRVADRDRAAVDVVLGRIDPELVARIEALRRKRLV